MRRHAMVMAAIFLAGCGKTDPPIQSISELVSQLEQADQAVQVPAAMELANRGPQAVEAVPALIQALQSPHAPVRSNSARALGEIGPGATEGVPALIKALSDPDYSVKSNAANALGKMGPAAQAAIPALEKLSQGGKGQDPCDSGSNALKKIRP